MRDPRAILYSDSDGVICDFYGGAEKVLGHPWGTKHDLSPTSLSHGARIESSEEFWENLPGMPDWKTYWHFIEKFSPHILTAVPSWEHDSKAVREGKLEWYHRNIPSLPTNRIHIVKREEKKHFARNGEVRNILIDDHPGNIKEFESAGGIGIHHVSAKVTILKLKELGYH
jgi:hypothetical protein